ncbi:MAG: ABC transporter ATP-binding protein [Comamonadaceae bacterium]|nr:MAG: ABC transporter ATP-binding protein [Comamonadaceae bacterium]
MTASSGWPSGSRDATTGAADVPDIIDIQGVSKRFGGLTAVDGVSLRVTEGARHLLIGPNGAGKTTLFHCITGVLQPTEGAVRLFGIDVTRAPQHRRTAMGLGRTFQITNVFADLTCAENVTLSLLGTKRVKWVPHLRVASLHDARDRARFSLDEVGLGGRDDVLAGQLSYGERRQLELAIALCTRPKVVFLDEPCAGLSPSERKSISALIAAFPRDITLVMIEHDMDFAMGLADRVSVLHHGKLILEGTPGEVRSDSGVRDIYFGHV